MNDLLRVLEGMQQKRGRATQKHTRQSTLNSRHDFSRIQSPSSINTYFECPRRYFYKYVKGLPTKPSIYLIRGKIIHSVLEDFFILNPKRLSPNGFDVEMNMIMIEDFQKKWADARPEILKLGLSKEMQVALFRDSKRMVTNFVKEFSTQLNSIIAKYGFLEAFKLLTPKREIYMKSHKHKVQGYIDAIYTFEKTRIIDYKTSSTDELRDEYRRQLSIYSLLFLEKFGKLPDEVGIHFLLYGLRALPATMDMVEKAVRDIVYVQERTVSGNIWDYPKGMKPLCKWRNGQCDFYDLCGGV